jgi:hypothetical protein
MPAPEAVRLHLDREPAPPEEHELGSIDMEGGRYTGVELFSTGQRDGPELV